MKPADLPANDPARDAQTRSAQREEPKPRLPHEHDQSADSQQSATPAIDDTGRQAHDDVRRGLKDTDRGPVLDKVYRERVRGGSSG